MASDIVFDWARAGRTGIPEVVYCPGKTLEQLIHLIEEALERQHPLLLTRLSPEVHAHLPSRFQGYINYCITSKTLLVSQAPEVSLRKAPVAIVAAGTTDLPVAEEARRTLRYLGLEVELYPDCGVAGLWRLLAHENDLRSARVVIAVAGMEGALFSVVAGLVPGLVVAVPTSTGYGVAADGTVPLNSALSSCSPGVVVVNIDNGFGAACAAFKIVTPSLETVF